MRADVQGVIYSQTRVNNEIRRLVHICAGTRVGVEDIRKQVNNQHEHVGQILYKLKEKQHKTSTMVIEASQIVVLHASRMDNILKQLLRAFGGFSITALRLLCRIIKTDLEIYTLLQQIQASIPAKPNLGIQDSFCFTDALGRTRVLQYEWFKHWEVFESMLKCNFKDCPGEGKILLGQYHVMNAKRRGSIIDRFRWEQSVFPGSEVNMSMIISTQVVDHTNRDMCLYCGGYITRSRSRSISILSGKRLD